MSENEKLSSEQLGEVSGGWSENRYDPNVCKGLTQARPECAGFAGLKWCDHLRCKPVQTVGLEYNRYEWSCAQQAFPPYKGGDNGKIGK